MIDSDTRRTGRAGPSRIAEGIALQRFAESRLPDDERIFFDSFAVHFIDPGLLEWAKTHPQEAQARAEELEWTMPGWANSIRARVRYFDDVVQNTASDGIRQMVVLGAGYDTRAYRIDALNGRVQVFEIDHPQTSRKKTEIISRVLGTLPEYVTAVPLDLEHDDLWENLTNAGYSRDASTLFVLEGLVMYLSREVVEELLSGIARNTGQGSSALFDCVPQFLADGTSEQEGARNILDFTVMIGEPILSGFAEGEVQPFLSGLGFSSVTVVPSSEYGRMYYHGKNAGRPVSSLLTFVRAELG